MFVLLHKIIFCENRFNFPIHEICNKPNKKFQKQKNRNVSEKILSSMQSSSHVSHIVQSRRKCLCNINISMLCVGCNFSLLAGHSEVKGQVSWQTPGACHATINVQASHIPHFLSLKTFEKQE